MSAWDRLDTENDLFVLTGLLFEWLEHLRTPVIGKDAMTYVVIHCDDIEKAMSKVRHISQNVIFNLLYFVKNHPVNNTTIYYTRIDTIYI